MTRIDPSRLAAARLWAAHRFPYMASGLFATRMISVPGIKTVAVDESWRMYVDPEVVESWSVSELGSILVHHTGHLLRDHAGRAAALGIGTDQSGHWTSAADAEINDDLIAAGVPATNGKQRQDGDSHRRTPQGTRCIHSSHPSSLVASYARASAMCRSSVSFVLRFSFTAL
jgi:predicted metal-dependent peptidase